MAHPTGRAKTGGRPHSGGRHERWFLLLLLFYGTLSVMLTSGGVGMCWDEAYYYPAGLKTRAWIEACFLETPAPVSGERLDFFWDASKQEPRGHPSFTRFLVALGLAGPGARMRCTTAHGRALDVT